MQCGDKYLSNMNSLRRIITVIILYSTLEFGISLGQRILRIIYDSEYTQLSINNVILYRILDFEVNWDNLYADITSWAHVMQATGYF